MNIVVAISILIGVITYSIFVIFCVVNWARRVTGLALLLAASLTLLWLSSPLLPGLRAYYLTLEPIAFAAWIVLLVRALGLRATWKQTGPMRSIGMTFGSALLAACVATFASLSFAPGLTEEAWWLPFHLALIVLNVLGLVLVEQLAQNSIADFRWRLRYLNIGLGLIFGFGLVTHALAVVNDGPVLVLVAIQPAVMAFLTPFVTIASLRNRTNQLRVSLSRNFFFRSGVLVSAGIFLLLVGSFGYLAELFAGDVGVSIAVLVGIAALALFIILVGSSRVRSQLRVQISKVLFEYRYDYREEWMRVTSQLTEPDPDFDLPQQALRAIVAVFHAKQSCIWLRNDSGAFIPLAHIEAPAWAVALSPTISSEINTFYSQHDWVLDLRDVPEFGTKVEASLRSSSEFSNADYLVPLFVESDLLGICMIGPSEAQLKLSWEDLDVIKLIATQCAGFLALSRANRELMEAEQLSAINQVSAFLLHDIKTISAQLSLMLENAEVHKANPDFVDDMVATTKNCVERMQKLMSALREPRAPDSESVVDLDLVSILQNREGDIKNISHQTEYDPGSVPVLAHANPEAVDTALTQLERNAREAAGNSGTVSVVLATDGEWATIQIVDNGPGMTADFLQNELFAPFRSTKGLSGMGIGAYQSRDLIRGCGGDLQVESKVGVGTTFTIKLPLARV